MSKLEAMPHNATQAAVQGPPPRGMSIGQYLIQRMRQYGNVEIPQSAFIAALKMHDN